PRPKIVPPAAPSAWEPIPSKGSSWKTRAKQAYKWYIKPRVPGSVDRYLALGARALAAGKAAQVAKERIPFSPEPRLELSGVVYTLILNPFDLRKDWQDLLSALLLALGDRPDVTLVLKLVVCSELTPQAVNGMLHYYGKFGLDHSCKIVLLPQ